MMKTEQLTALKEETKTLIASGKTADALHFLIRSLPSFSEKYNILIQLSARNSRLKEMEIYRTESFEVIGIEKSRLEKNILGFLDMLTEGDFVQPEPGGAVRKNKMGSLLYAIPAVMEMLKEQKCIIRLAFDEKFLLENFFHGDDTHIRSIRRIDKRMEVELIDPNEEKVFAVRTISSTMQKVEEDDYTEWLFFVKPLIEGKHILFLKISIITNEEGEKIRKEIVLQEEIEVVAKQLEEVELGTKFKHSGLIFSVGSFTAGGIGESNEEPANETANIDKSTLEKAAQLIGSKGSVAGGIIAVCTIILITFLVTSAPEKALQIGEISSAPARVIEENSQETPATPLSNEDLSGQDDASTDENNSSQLAAIDLGNASVPEAPAKSPPIPSPPPPTSEEVPNAFKDDDVGLVDLNIENVQENDPVRDDKSNIVNPSSEEWTDDNRLSTTEPFVPPPPPPPPPEPKEEVFRVVEEMPRFPAPECENLGTMHEKNACADRKMLDFIYANLKYPAIARENGVEGTVVIQFEVEKDGTLDYAKILRDIGAGCGEEALRVVNLMNESGLKWVPGKQRGEPTRVELRIPVKFRLD